MSLPEDFDRILHLEQIFMPCAMRQREEARAQQGYANLKTAQLRFAHYTSAEAALNIIRTKRIWMRNVKSMSDYREVQHGFDLLQEHFTLEKKKEFVATLDLCSPGAAAPALEEFFNGWLNSSIKLNTYVTSLSLHHKKEDQLGRLSMWRAFGTSPTRVAIVIKTPFSSGAAAALHMMFSPVAYLREEEVRNEMSQVLQNVLEHIEFLRGLEPGTISTYVFMMLFAAVACLKHEGFREEQEWRGVYCPQITKSDLMGEPSVETIGGIPQHVFKIPLDRDVSDKLAGIDLAEILDHLIIGPTPYPWVLRQAFIEELERAGIPGAREKVFVSDIPIRF